MPENQAPIILFGFIQKIGRLVYFYLAFRLFRTVLLRAVLWVALLERTAFRTILFIVVLLLPFL